MEYKIYTGTVMSIKKGFFQEKFRIMYCGMPNEKTFALTPQISKGYQGFSPTIFYPINSKLIHVLKKDFDVIEVNPEYIIIGD